MQTPLLHENKEAGTTSPKLTVTSSFPESEKSETDFNLKRDSRTPKQSTMYIQRQRVSRRELSLKYTKDTDTSSTNNEMQVN